MLKNPRPVDDIPVDGQLEHGITSNRMFDHEALYAAHIADLNAHTYNPLELIRIGGYYLYPTGFGATKVLVANYLLARLLVVVRDMTFDRIACDISVQAGQKIRMGIYNNGTNLYPGTLALDAGEITLSGTGVQAITISEALTKGVYWLVIISDGTPTAAIDGGFDFTLPALGLYAAPFTVTNNGYSKAQAYGALPDPFPAAGGIFYEWCYRIPLRVLSLD